MKRLEKLDLHQGWIPFFLLFASILGGGVYSQDRHHEEPPEVSSCSLWEIKEQCSEGEVFKINDISLYYEIDGQGEPLLLLHGGGGSAEHFNLMLPELRQHYRVITPDSRAHGRSTDTLEPLSYRQMAADMIGLLDSLKLVSAYVGGWSDGASIALHMAIYYPDRVRALLLTPVDLSSEGLTDLFWEDTKEMNFPEKLEKWWRTRLPPSQKELSGIKVPTLFVIGKEEQYVKLEHVKWQYQSIPGAEVVWITDADHILITKPAAVNMAFLSFLNKHQ